MDIKAGVLLQQMRNNQRRGDKRFVNTDDLRLEVELEIFEDAFLYAFFFIMTRTLQYAWIIFIHYAFLCVYHRLNPQEGD